ncbi:RNA polymerase subunit RPABC4/transcription elongation factor Spt4 [Salirhabdus euzebyi]|uniref:RNA polymerase subunit RPABC4/transcription elongation factor Spt4 n=1 Tax=Salirhabdus euzebyi TaxID=394506 RepID=A0A841Q3Z0_9BACI|nr:zinc ribbon domain-containing protein [Salirhabdus euzebyi]MBB6453082.1 RNA polymerase subunit RPABC4/transcription elongation factor Spt4 [Salirhabdus euzebyi]
MSNIDSKFTEGVSKLQGGLQQGKQKFQNAQEAQKVKRNIAHLSNQKGKLLIELGQALYFEYRKGAIVNEEITNRAAAIEELDVTLHQQLTLLNELTSSKDEGFACECGTSLSHADQFCPNCGTKVVKPEEEIKETKVCNSCSQEIPFDANFCNVCGSKAHS